MRDEKSKFWVAHCRAVSVWLQRAVTGGTTVTPRARSHDTPECQPSSSMRYSIHELAFRISQ